MHDFENIDPAVMQDVFYICRCVAVSFLKMRYCVLIFLLNFSLHIPRLPLVFILSCASPPQMSFLHVAYPRTTLTLLGLTKIVVKSGLDVLELVIHKVRLFSVKSV